MRGRAHGTPLKDATRGCGSLDEDLGLARASQHLVDLIQVRLLCDDLLSSILLEEDGAALGGRFEEFVVQIQRSALVLQTLPEDVADVMLARFRAGRRSSGRGGLRAM